MVVVHGNHLYRMLGLEKIPIYRQNLKQCNAVDNNKGLSFITFIRFQTKGLVWATRQLDMGNKSQCKVLGQRPSGVTCQCVKTDKVVRVSTRTHSLILKHPICHCWSDKHTFCVVTLPQDDTIVSNNSQRKYEPNGDQDRIALRVQHLHNAFQHCHLNTTKVHNCCLRLGGLMSWSFSAKGKSWEALESQHSEANKETSCYLTW